ncbi:hypothetical protein [Richelia sinica]|uniref:hypothetical protein n=1 Tax=Richelia sinica TaxID=1357545 RepID=UPI001687C3B5|nr:hypothetical protein [Richelia sinica]MBD2667265.1 hypothetical protein [Richelia sinica FACHB-800]
MKALPPAKSMKIKNHITSRGRALNSQLSNKFGITLSDFERAVMGDLSSMQKIGELSRQAGFMKEFAPKLKDAYLTIIEGTETYNLALADILKASGKSSLAIDKAGMQTSLANQKYINQRVELANQFLLDKKTENVRHQYQLNYQEIRGYVNAHLTAIDQQVAVLEVENQPEVRQIAANQQYENRVLNEALSNGEQARYDLIPKKDYRTGFMGKLLEFKSALGF